MAFAVKLLKSAVVNKSTLGSHASKLFSTSAATALHSGANSKTNEKVVMTDDEHVIVCWHPEAPVAYECTKPVPTEVLSTDSVLKVQALMPTMETFKPKYEKMALKELQLLTHTSKEVWYPKRRRQRYREMDPLKEKRDREYL